MEAHVVEIVLDNRRLGEAQLSQSIAGWRAGLGRCVFLRALLPQRLLLSSVATPHCTLLQSGTRVQRVALIHSKFIKIFPLLPLPVFPSPLFMLLNDEETENRTYPLLVSSYTLLRFFAWAERIIFEASSEEIYYNTLNAVRILEFTILDYLGVDTKRQTALVSPDWYWLSTTSLPPASVPAVYGEVRADMQRAVAFFCQWLKVTKPSWSDLPATYDPLRLAPDLPQLRALIRDVLSNRMFACQNREGECKRAEGTLGEFKSCGRCGWFRYCSKECQAAHWRLGHKSKCGSADVKKEIQRIVIAADTDEDAIP